LGGATGALEGYGAKQERLKKSELLKREQERQALLDALATAQAYQQLGFRPTGPVRTTPDPAARTITALEMPELPTATDQAAAGTFGRSMQAGLGVRPTTELTPFEATRQRAFTEANQRALGTMAPTTPLRSALTTAAVQPPTPAPAKKLLDDTRLRQFERAVGTQPAVPETQIEVPGMGRIGFDRPLTDDEKLAQRMREKEAELELLEARRLMEIGPSNRAIFGMLQKEGIFGPQVAYEDVQNLDLKPYFTDYLRDKSAAAAYERTQLNVQAQAGMGGYVVGIDPTGKPIYYTAPRGGGEMKPTGVQAPQPARGGAAASKNSLLATLPSVINAADRLNSLKENYVDRISGVTLDAMNTAQATEGAPGLMMRMATGAIANPTPEESEYLQLSNSIADAVSRATDVGVLSNFDVLRFRLQTMPTALDSPAAKRMKFRTLQGWANWLKNNKSALQAADRAYEEGKSLEQQGLVWSSTPPGGDIAAGQVIQQGPTRKWPGAK
jgi:hypothetical protein